VPKHVRWLLGFDQKVLLLYARAMTVREIQGNLEDLNQVEIASTVISTVTDAVVQNVLGCVGLGPSRTSRRRCWRALHPEA
jgi:putative transposase